MKRLSAVLFVWTLMGCVKTITLKNGRTRAAREGKVFGNRIYFDESILARIDTTVIYEECRINYYGNSKLPICLARLDDDYDTFYGVYRFYGNGRYNYFSLNREIPELTNEMFDPSYTGWRGVLYKRNGQILGDMFTQIGQLPGELGIRTDEFIFKGDTLKRKFRNREKVFVKRAIDQKLLEQKANW